MFYDVKINEEGDTLLLEGQASGAITKGGGAGGKFFVPDEAFSNSVEIMTMLARSVSQHMTEAMAGSNCGFEVTFGVRADGNGTVMISQDTTMGQFIVSVRSPD